MTCAWTNRLDRAARRRRGCRCSWRRSRSASGLRSGTRRAPCRSRRSPTRAGSRHVARVVDVRRDVDTVRVSALNRQAARAVRDTALERLQQAQRQAVDLRHAVVDPQAGAVPLIDDQIALRVVPLFLDVLRILIGAAGQRSARHVLAVEVAPGVRQRVGAADVGARAEAIGRLAGQALIRRLYLSSTSFSISRQVELLSKRVGDAAGRQVGPRT